MTAVRLEGSRIRRLAGAVFLACLTGCGADRLPPGAEPLPPEGFLGSWQWDGPTEVFNGAELYGHIDGGAEVFLELGFDRLVIQRYRSQDGDITAELYLMSDPVAALGIYLMKCGSEQPDPDLPYRHTVNAQQLQLLRGSCYLSLYAIEVKDGPGATLVAFAREIAGGVAAQPAADVLDLLPEEGMIAGSERVVRGPFTLEPLYTFGEGDILLLEGRVTAVASQYQDGVRGRFTRIIVPYPDPPSAARAFRNLAANLDPYLTALSSAASSLEWRDYRDQFGRAALEGARIDIQVNLTAPPGT